MSHHHGLGKQTAPWFVEQVERGHVEVIRSLKRHFDPNNIMNPGGTLGLDMSPEQREKRWGKQDKCRASVGKASSKAINLAL
jgi:alkyldihydroxyacetonephosphate synthase